MPGLDQRGPCGQGAMTGRGQGLCRNNGTLETTGRFGRGNRSGSCRRRGFGQGYAPSAQFTESEPTQADLADRARRLEDELNAVKRQIKAMPNED